MLVSSDSILPCNHKMYTYQPDHPNEIPTDSAALRKNTACPQSLEGYGYCCFYRYHYRHLRRRVDDGCCDGGDGGDGGDGRQVDHVYMARKSLLRSWSSK